MVGTNVEDPVSALNGLTETFDAFRSNPLPIRPGPIACAVDAFGRSKMFDGNSPALQMPAKPSAVMTGQNPAITPAMPNPAPLWSPPATRLLPRNQKFASELDTNTQAFQRHNQRLGQQSARLLL